jgi:hypothetical protein
MNPVLSAVKASAAAFHGRLEEVMTEKGKAISQLRIRAIVFRDFGDSADDAIEATRQCLRQSPDSASEVEALTVRHWQLQLCEAVKEQRNLALTGLHEFLEGPAAAPLVVKCQDGPKRIPGGVLVPEGLDIGKPVVHR